MTAVRVLEDSQRYKLDGSDDALLQRAALRPSPGCRLPGNSTQLYRERIPPVPWCLIWMSSWVSHLPEEIAYDEVIGHGLNDEELEANPRLDPLGSEPQP